MGGACKSCEPGRFASSSGAHNCSLAGKGHTVNKERTQQVPCGQGKFADGKGAAECDLCPPGKFSSANVTSQCEDCAKGYFQDTPGSLESKMCNGGTFSDEEGMAECTDCGYDQFTGSNGPNSHCTACYTSDNSFGLGRFRQCLLKQVIALACVIFLYYCMRCYCTYCKSAPRTVVTVQYDSGHGVEMLPKNCVSQA